MNWAIVAIIALFVWSLFLAHDNFRLRDENARLRQTNRLLSKTKMEGGLG
jgi:hypothetical protein